MKIWRAAQAFENIAEAHATFLQQIHEDVCSMKLVIPQIRRKINTRDGYVQNMDKRVTTVRDEAANYFK